MEKSKLSKSENTNRNIKNINNKQIEDTICKFITADNAIRLAKQQIKKTKKDADLKKEMIVKYMLDNGFVKISGLENGLEYIELVQKQVKKRPSYAQILNKVKELMQKNIHDPDIIIKQINECGGSKLHNKLMRKNVRIKMKDIKPILIEYNKLKN